MAKVSYNCGDGIIEIILRDDSGAKLEHFKLNQKDTLHQSKILKYLQKKYGLFDSITIINVEKEDFFEF